MRKVSLIFAYTSAAAPGTVARSGSWSESHYTAAAFTGTAIVTALQSLAALRSRLLPGTVSIVAARITDLDAKGLSRIVPINYPGLDANTKDIPQVCLRLSATAQNNLNVVKETLTAIPDNIIQGGAYQPPPFNNFNANLLAYLAGLGQGWTGKGRDKNKPLINLREVTNTGIAELLDAPGWIDGEMVQVLRTKDADRRTVSGFFKAYQGADPFHYVLQGWPNKNVVGGQIRLADIVYPQYPLTVDLWTKPVVGTRKVGRPLFPYSGRRRTTK